MDEKEIVENPLEENPEEKEEEDVEEAPEEEGEEEEKEEEEKEEEKPIDVEAIKIEIRDKAQEEKIEYGEDIDEDDVKTIGTIVEKQTAGVKKALQESQDKNEIDSFLREKPEFEKYRPVIEKYIKHPAYSQIPVKNIASMVASDELLRIGAKKEREAQNKADATRTKGSAVRKPQGGATDWAKAPKDDFEAHKRKVLGQH